MKRYRYSNLTSKGNDRSIQTELQQKHGFSWLKDTIESNRQAVIKNSSITSENFDSVESDTHFPFFYSVDDQSTKVSKRKTDDDFGGEILELHQDIGLPLSSGEESQTATSTWRGKDPLDTKLHQTHLRSIEDVELLSRNLNSNHKQKSQSLKGKEPHPSENKNVYQGIYRKFTFRTSVRQAQVVEKTSSDTKRHSFIPQFNKAPKQHSFESDQRPYGRSAQLDDELIARRRRSTRRSEVFEHLDSFKKERTEARVICKRFGRTNSLLS